MREIFLERFFEDLQKVIDEREEKNDEEYNTKRKEQDKVFEEFFSSLTKEQRKKYKEYELLYEEERLILEEDLYIFALKKGMAMGIEVGKSFK